MLETALENMDRVDAFIMLRNHRSPGNVFEEAHRCVCGWVGGGWLCIQDCADHMTHVTWRVV
jgi:hypothetical protein